METNVLEYIGLSKREARVYLALLELGSSTTGDIVRKTEIPSSKIYEILNRLMEKSLVSYVIVKHQKHFQSAEPEILLRDIEERKRNLEKLLPELKAKQKFAKEKQYVEMFEGRQGIFKMIYNLVEQAKKGDEYLSFTVGKEHDDTEIATFYTNLTWRRQEKGLKIRVLTNEKIRGIFEKRYRKKHLATINNRYTSFNFPQGIIVLNDKLIILNWKDKATAIVITSNNMAKQFKKFFYELYNKAKP